VRLQHPPLQVVRRGHRFTVELGDQTAGFQPRLRGGTPLFDLGHQDSPIRLEVLGHLGRKLLDHDPQPGALHPSELDEIVGHTPGEVGGNRESNPLVALASLGHDEGVHPDDFPVNVDERAARIPPVDGGVGLDEILVAAEVDGPVRGAYVTDADRIAQLKRGPDGQRPLPDSKIVGVRKPHRRQTASVDPDDREVRVAVAGHDRGVGTFAVGEKHFDFVRLLNHVVVGEDVAVGADDHPAPESRDGAGARRRLTEKAAKQLRVRAEFRAELKPRHPNFLARVDGDHGRANLLGRVLQRPLHRLGDPKGLLRLRPRVRSRHPPRGPARPARLGKAQVIVLKRAQKRTERDQNHGRQQKSQTKSLARKIHDDTLVSEKS